MTSLLRVTCAAGAAMLWVGAASAQDMQIAVAGPITGGDAQFGEQMKRGAEMAVKDINAKGGVLGKKLSLSVGDDACDPKQAVSVANDLVNKKVIFVAGHYCSSSSIPASAIYADAGVLQISPASTNTRFTDEAFDKKWINVFRTAGRDDKQGAIAAKYLSDHFKGKKVAVIDDQTTYGKGLADETRKNMAKLGLPPAMNESVTKGDKDFNALVSKMKQANIDAFFYGGYVAEAGLIVRQAREGGLKAPMFTDDGVVSKEFWQIAGDKGEGVLMTFPPDPRDLKTAKSVVDEFKKAGYDPEGYTLLTYAAIQCFAEAATKAKSVKLADVSKALHANKFETVLGTIGFDQKGDIIGPDFVIYVWHNGDYKELSKS